MLVTRLVDRGWKAHNDRDVQHHVGDVVGLGGPERVDELPQSCAEGVGERRHGRRARAPLIGEPEVAVPGRCTETEWLRQADQDLAEHGHPEYPAPSSRAGISDPIAGQQQRGGDDDSGLGAAFVEGKDDDAGWGSPELGACCLVPMLFG